MQTNVNKIVVSAIEKSKREPNFSQDLMNYVQYLSLSSCQQNKLPELKQILEEGNMKELLEFGSQSVPEFEKKIVEYINKY